MDTARDESSRRAYKATWAASARQHAREMRTPDARDVGLAILRLALARAVEKKMAGMVEVDNELARVASAPTRRDA